jgi:hypothetical protein
LKQLKVGVGVSAAGLRFQKITLERRVFESLSLLKASIIK